MEALQTPRPQLKQTLRAVKIFFISFTVIIGTGVFNDYGSASKTTGPGGMLIAFFIVSSIAVPAMEGLSEMIQLFPTINPIVELVHEFVDEDLALLTGFVYWFGYTSFVPVQIARAAQYLDFFVGPSVGWESAKAVTFYVLSPIVITLINCTNVELFGYVESLCGFVKVFVLFVVVAMCFYISGEGRGASFILQGVWDHLPDANSGSALCLSIEFIAFSFCGIETSAVTTFEAKEIHDLRWPSQWITLATFFIYLLSALSQGMLIDWSNDTDVPTLYGSTPTGTQWIHGEKSSTTSAPIIAAVINRSFGSARAMNAMFIFSALSGANSALYVASRMLYGLAHANASRWRGWKMLAHVNKSGVPVNAVLLSAGCLCWLPFTKISSSTAAAEIIPWFNNAGCLCVIFVWGTVNLAFVRYEHWFGRFRNSVLAQSQYQRVNRWSSEKGFFTLLTFRTWMQPAMAYVAFIGSYGVVFIFASAFLWRDPKEITANDFFQYYTAPALLPLLWISLKFYRLASLTYACKSASAKYISLEDFRSAWPYSNFTWYKDLSSNDRAQIEETIHNLTEYLKPDQQKYVDVLTGGHELASSRCSKIEEEQVEELHRGF